MKKLLVFGLVLFFFNSVSYSIWYNVGSVSKGGGFSLCPERTAIGINGDPYVGKSTKGLIWDSNNNVRKQDDGSGNSNCYGWDDSEPDIDKVQLTLNGKLDNSFILADESATLSITMGSNVINVCNPNVGERCSPFGSIKYKLEEASNPSGTIINEKNCSGNCDNSWSIEDIRNISKVDNDRNNSIGAREYTLEIVELCDLAGNCWTGSETYKWNVFATKLSTNPDLEAPIETVYSNFNASLFGNDNDFFEAKYKLKDRYGNNIIPTTTINRTIDVDINYDNFVYLNQYKKSGQSGIRYKFLNLNWDEFDIGNNKTKSNTYSNLSVLLNNNENYTIDIKSYVPTNAGYSFTTGDITINSIDFEVSDDIGGDGNKTKDIDNILIFEPILTGELTIATLAPELQSKDFNIDLGINDSSTYDENKLALQIDYKSDDNPIKPFIGYGNDNLWSGSNYGTDLSVEFSTLGSLGDTDNYDFSFGVPNIFNNNVLKNLYQRFRVKENNYLASENNRGSLYTYIKHKYNDVVGVWPSDKIVGSTKNFLTKDTNIFIRGMINFSNKGDKTQFITGDVRNIITGISRSDLRNYMHKQIFNLKKGRKSYSQKDIININNCDNECFIYDNTLIYYREGDIVLNNNMDTINKDILIVSNGGNVYIDKNLKHNNNLGLISLRDNSDTEWDASGNIFIDIDVTDVHGLLYADGGMMSYKQDNGIMTKGYNIPNKDLRNQLYIKGVLRTYNNLGHGNVNNSCPYFVDIEKCTPKLARSFDLEYGRTFHLISADIVSSGSGAEDYWLPVRDEGGYNIGKLAGGVECSYDNSYGVVCDEGTLLKQDGDIFKKENIDKIINKLSPIFIEHDPLPFESNFLIFSEVLN